MVLVLAALMVSCAEIQTQAKQDDAQHDFEQVRQMLYSGDTEAGLTKLKALSAAHPENAQYRNTLKLQQDMQIAGLLKTAEVQWQQNQLAEAEASYRQVLAQEPSNMRATEGLRKLTLSQNHAMMLVNAQAAMDKQEPESAKSIVRTILAEDANNPAARSLYEKLDKQSTDKLTTVPKIISAFKKPITLEFKNVPIKSVFEYIGKATRLNFTYDQELHDSLLTSVFLRDTPLEEAIGVILTTNQLGKKVLNENTLLIYPLSRSQEYVELYVRSFYLNNMDAKRAMNLIKTVLKIKDVYIDEKLNTLVIRDSAENIQIAEKLIASQDLVEPEVMLEVEVMEINRRNLEEIGIRYPTQASVGVQGKSTTTDGVVTTTPGRLTIAELKNFNSGLGVFTITDPVLALNLLQQNTDTNLLANPKIRVKNRDKAKIHVGDKIPVLTSVANSTGFVSQTVSYIEVGIKLDVEPTILLQDQVAIKVGLEVSNVTDQIKTDSGVLAYTIGSRNANTTLQLKDGETQILAGLFKDDEQKISNSVPGISSLPLIGRFFANKNNDKRKNEIVLLITPRILHNIAPANASYTHFPSGVVHSNMREGRSATQQLSQPVSAVVAPPVQTLEATQANQAKTDQEFANQVQQQNSELNGYGGTENKAQ